MPGKSLVRGQERKRLKSFLKYLDEIQARDGKVEVVEDESDFKGMLVFDSVEGKDVLQSAAIVRERVLDLLSRRT